VEAAATTRENVIERRFRIRDRGSTLRVEALGGLSTFLTMSYILFVNPAILSAAGVPFKAVAVATALAAAITTAAMALLTNYPFALAQALVHNNLGEFEINIVRKVQRREGMD
jgi:AGZA family xanthine/uracil permease-like MFS transporter